MFFASDNTGPVHPQIMDALARANDGYATPYGNDPLMDEVRTRLREIFEAPEAAVYLVATGTAANCLGLACIAPPTHTVFCSPNAHIHEDECNAPEFYTGGAKLTLVGTEDKITPEVLHATIAAEGSRGVHGPQRGPVSLTQATEKGQIYDLDELAALSAVARDHDLPVQMDGARFANALVALDCTPAEMTWRAGIDVLSFGGTKNGCMGVEAVILFDPAKAWEFELRRKRGAHLFSKHRYLSAQMAAYLRDDLWRQSARRANANMARLVAGLRERNTVRLRYEPVANIAFADLPRATVRRLLEAGAAFNVWDGDVEGEDPDTPLTIRLVSDWSLPETEIDRFLDLVRD
ncbi:L-threonine aldolase, low-specificity, putative [Pseudooceanicola batsensis HTCC2597]|uniref:L-threonine aldolase n=1 Tax=Pseudooceanicola batsensis (strain ATCC BAA-863 / DSM 15984 / KCTC 12145 / HTCC2597) TaxID=252305 RepID=A3TTZ1_PSEBH|nr:beta-eliminating lyase-related protein [Pseudooceanicola batsensis]EAQ05118.1 L-threonine aldolase, low-specificity, putative [Pseudooceanicola batsensis HTCC2597]